MTILTGPVNLMATTFSVSDDSLLLPNGLPQMLQIESEKFLIRGFEAVGAHNTRWYVERGVDGTLAAAHSGGVAITVVSSGGVGGGVSGTDGTTTVDPMTSIEFPTGMLADAGGGAAVVNSTVVQQNNAVGFDVLGLAGQSDAVVRIRQNDANGDALLITGEGPDANGTGASLIEAFDWQGNPLLDLRQSGRFLLSTANVGGNFPIFQVKDDNGNIVLQVLNDGSVHIKTGTSIVADL